MEEGIKKFIISNLNDILILCGLGFFIFTMFKFISVLAGMLSLSITLIILGLVLSKAKSLLKKEGR